MVLAGNNEDFLNAEAYIQFLPAEQGKHGRIYFGFCYEAEPARGSEPPAGLTSKTLVEKNILPFFTLLRSCRQLTNARVDENCVIEHRRCG